MKTYYAVKKDQTHVYDKDGKRLFITRLVAKALPVVQIKNQEKDKYLALQTVLGQKKQITKPLQGHIKNADLKPKYLREIKLAEAGDKKVGDSVKVSEVLKVGDLVQVTGKSKGAGFAGVMKRRNFRGGPKTHGQSDRPRSPGSIGQGTSPGRIWKGKKMAGRMGNVNATTRGCQVIKIDEEHDELWLSGSVPGKRHALIKITKIGEKAFKGLFTTEKTKSEAEMENQAREVKYNDAVEQAEDYKKEYVDSTNSSSPADKQDLEKEEIEAKS